LRTPAGATVAARAEEEIIEQIRIGLAGLPALAADLVERAVGRQTDMAVVGRVESATALLELARMTAPDVVVVGMEEPELSPDQLAVFGQHPRLIVLGLQNGGVLAHLYQLRPKHFELGEVAAEDLIEQIRRATSHPPWASTWRPTPRSPR
jgi:DNA-binding NarL/FixJ family response regulator